MLTDSPPLPRPLLLLLLGLILLAGAWLRFHDLAGVPPGLWYDEALNGQDAAAVWREGGGFKLIYLDVFPREPMFQTLLALAVRIFGARVEVMRAVSACVGTLTILLLFGMLRRPLGDRAALAAAGTLAVLRWHAIFSRLIFRTLILAAWMVGLVWAVLAYRRRPGLARAAWVGVMLGGGFYTYLGWYFMGPFTLALVGWMAWGRLREHRVQPPEERIGAPVRELAVVAATALLVFAPLGLHYVREPQHLFARPGAVSVFSAGGGEALREIGRNLGDLLLMFHLRGDHVARHGVPHAPALDPAQGVALLVGLVGCWLLVRRRNPLGWILPAWLASGLLATVFTQTDSPNTLRTLCVTPALAAIVGVGLALCAERMRPRLAAAFIAVALAGSFVLTNRSIFETWAHDPAVWQQFKGDMAQLGRASAAAPAGVAVFLPELMYKEDRTLNFFVMDDARVVPYADWSILKPWPATPACAGRPAPRERWIAVTVHNQAMLDPLRRLVPAGRIGLELQGPPPERNVWGLFYVVPEESLPSAEALSALENQWRGEMRY